MAKSKVIVLEQSLVKSEAWLSLSKTAIIVYLIFRTRCQFAKMKGKPRKRGPVIVNNGEIVFTYIEAEKRYSISKSRFGRALKELVAKGFIDIAATGMGVHKVETWYAISERWRDYGTPEFKEVKWPKPNIANPGFKRGNKLWMKAHKKKSSVKNAHGAVYENEHGPILAMRTNEHGQKIIIQYKWRNGKWLARKIA
ncbi:MAG: hypothetical protein ACFFDP_06260 [Promethearchaeota archaeon]